MDWVKAFHIIAAVAWFAGLLCLPIVMAAHATTEDDRVRERFRIMERKLFNIIMTPAAVVTLVLGILLLVMFAVRAYPIEGWLYTKLGAVAIYFGLHIYMGNQVTALRYNRFDHGPGFYWALAGVMAVLAAVLVVLSHAKPF